MTGLLWDAAGVATFLASFAGLRALARVLVVPAVPR